MQDLSVRRSAINGRGVFALKKIPARCKLGEISGALVRLPEARRAIETAPRIYLIELSRRLALDCSRGNVFRHLNHSCRPNCYLRVFRRRVEVYTLKTIPPGKELTLDYGQTPHRNGMSCSCGSAACRKKL
ncbi:MAG: SET domain-containing protein [Methylacidiphilales bacterium]|nr:SET domain-containing protein [Candidatus Methylacidiphilales bacterium]